MQTQQAKILNQLRNIENELSPENLYQDGERSVAEARRAEKALLKERDRLIDLLGYIPNL